MLIGLVGKPSVGKSTFFKAATLAEVEIANYPFTTIKANHGVAYVKLDCACKHFNVKCNPRHGFCIESNRFVPIDLMDVAGLVPGASEGKGMGNSFLNDLREADAFIQVIDISGKTDIEGKPCEDHDVSLDIEFLEKELDNWYFSIFEKGWNTFARRVEMQGQKLSEAIFKQFSGLKVTEDQVKQVLRELNLSEKCSTWSEAQVREFSRHLRKLSKPMVVAANKCDSEKGEENFKKLVEKFKDLKIIACSADSELALRQAAKAEMIKYVPGEKSFEVLKELNEKQTQGLEKIKENVLSRFEFGTGVQEVLNHVVFNSLGYLPIFPGSVNMKGDSKGNILPDCFLLPPKASALDFAYFLHTDFGKNFVKAINAKTKMVLGKEYELKFGDAIEILTK